MKKAAHRNAMIGGIAIRTAKEQPMQDADDLVDSPQAADAPDASQSDSQVPPLSWVETWPQRRVDCMGGALVSAIFGPPLGALAMLAPLWIKETIIGSTAAAASGADTGTAVFGLAIRTVGRLAYKGWLRRLLVHGRHARLRQRHAAGVVVQTAIIGPNISS
jgi:hypothetical protein